MNIRKGLGKGWVVGMLLGSVFLIEDVQARDFKGRLGIGASGGISILTQDIEKDIRKQKEAIVRARLLYGLTDASSAGPLNPLTEFFFLGSGHRLHSTLVGLDLEWEQYNIEGRAGSLNYGKATTLSILPFAQLRIGGFEAFSPYFLLGAGLHLNSFAESANFNALCLPGCSISPKHSVAVKIGGGADYFISPHIALNLETAWKWNAYETRAKGIPAGVKMDRFRMSNISFTTGLSYYF